MAEAELLVAVAVVTVEDCGEGWVVVVVAVLVLVEKRCLMKCQEEESALWVLNFGWEGEDGCECDEGEILRFFEDGCKRLLLLLLLFSCFVVVDV